MTVPTLKLNKWAVLGSLRAAYLFYPRFRDLHTPVNLTAG